MKTKKMLAAIGLAIGALAAPFATRASTGDIVDIRVMDTDAMTFGARNSLSPSLCSAENPLVAGDDLYIRVRMLVRNADEVRGSHGSIEPKTWYFAAGALGESLLYRPKLGLMVGDRPAYAEYSDYGPRAWQKSGMLVTDDSGAADTTWKYYTDFYFVYKVQAGDLGLPVKLMNSTGDGPASNLDTNTGYFLLNCSADGTNHYVLQDSDGNAANFWFGPEIISTDWPTGISGDGPLRNFDLSEEGAFVKTIDFDKVNASGESYSDGDVWRYVYPGMSAAPATLPMLVVGGGTNAAATSVYIWSADETVAVPVASGANTISTEDGKTVLKVLVPAGAETVTFSMKGADSAAVGATTTIYLSPVKNAVYRPTGELVDVTVSRTVEVVTAPEPTVTIFLGGDMATDTVTADADYVTAKKQLAVKMTPTCDYPVTVQLNAEVSGDDTLSTLNAIYDANLLRIADGSYGGDPVNERKTSVTIPANTSVVYLNVYVLGGTSRTASKGVTFTTTKTSGPDNVTTSGACTLKIVRSTPVIVSSDPAFSSGEESSTVTVVSGQSQTFALEISDSYRDINDADTGYTFKWACDGEDIDDDVGVTMNEDGVFEGSAKFWNITEGKELTLCVVNPDGRTSAKVKYNLVVSDARKTTISFTDSSQIVFAEGQTAYLNLGLSQPYKGTGYIFLGADDPADLACVTSALTSAGAQIAQGTTSVATPRQIRFLDGDRDVTLKAVLCTANDPATKVTTYVEGTVSFTVTNVPPQVTSLMVAGQYLTPDMNGNTIDPVSRGVAKSFSLVAADVEADLNATGDDAMKVKWEIDGTTYEREGDPTTYSVQHTFANSKASAQVRVYVKDKDMATYPATPNFMFYVPVSEKPGLSITTSAEGGIFNETDKALSTVTVRLSEPASDEIRVRFTVSQTADGGFMKIRTVAGSVEQALDDGGSEIPGAYDLIFAGGVTRKDLVVSDMDGTNDTMAGLDLNAKVTTETTNADGVKWCDFYTEAESTFVRIQNVAPEIIRPTEAEEAYTNMNASANTPYAISYGCTDVTADLEAGVTVEITIDGVPVLTDTLSDRTVKTYSAEFEGEGSHVVEFAFTDKDQMTSRRSINYYVQPSKNLELRAHGPARAVGSSGGYSQHYQAAAGLGAGRVFVGENGPQKVQNFVHTYSFGVKETSVNAFAFGYKADGSYDNGSLLPGPDKGIDSNGSWAKGQTIADDGYYNYTAQHRWGRLGFDSFLYAWACNNSESTSTSGGESTTTTSLFFNMGDSGEMKIPMPDSDSSSGSSSSSASDKTYPKQFWEAVFSRELFAADNCGDINQDGIPDIVVYRYGLGIFDSGAIAASEGAVTEGDLTDVRDYNGDLDKSGGDSPDFLPSDNVSVYGALIPGLAGTWGGEFGARLEIRGYHDGLNDALAQLGFDVESDRVYAVATTNDDDSVTWSWSESCTISETEWYAWTEFAAANGLDWTDSANWAKWSPERPTSPVKSDTDGDGFDDGYEYYFWYKAHVGWLETDASGNKVHKRLTGRRYDPKNPGDGALIDSETIESLMDPQVRTDAGSADTRDTDNDGLPDLLEFEIGTNPFDFDTDGDGLPDGWELMIAGLNPLLDYSAADAKMDATRNYDGDAMAITSYQLELANKTPVNPHPEHVQYTTFAVIDPEGDTDGVQWYATKADVALKTNTVSCWTFKLADGTGCVALESPLLTDDGRLAKALDRGVAFTAATETTVEVDDSDPENPVTNEITTVVRGWPVRLEAGTLVDSESLTSGTDVSVLSVAGGIEEASANAAWLYGRGSVDGTFGQVSDTAAEYGCLALGRQKAVPAGAEICAAPSGDRDVAILHYLVYQQFGFDPRTAWRAKSPLADRWGKTANGEAVEGVFIADRGGYCAYPARTRDYAAYDEFLVYSFFLNNGCDMSGTTYVISDKAPYLAKVWGAFTTNPQGKDEPGNITLDLAGSSGDSGAATEYYFGRNSENGADTDGDGVPDGWELYVMSGPKSDGAFVFAHPYAGFATGLNKEAAMPTSAFSPFVASAQSNDTNNQIYLGGQGNDDGLNEYQEFESTDAMNHYADLSDTVVHTGDWKWFNKFFPTDPWNVDTDGDCLSDAAEGQNFVYGTPADNGSLRSIPGGGLNPNSVDTDCDGLPDAWEVQFKGKTPFPGDLAEEIASRGNKATDADGNEIGNYLQGLVDGMDGTVNDASSYPVEYEAVGDDGSRVTRTTIAYGANQVVNRDYDHDGLENWQEYLVGTMRCWRYDDPFSPWESIPTEFYWTYNDTLGSWVWDPKYADLGMDSDEFWYSTLVDKTSPLYNPRLVTDSASGSQYFSRLTNVWDAAYLDNDLGVPGGAYYWFYNRVGDTRIKDLWSPLNGPLPIQVGWLSEPRKYASCSPLDADTDRDGMDDYYELFHGMNPLLGKSGVRSGGATSEADGPFDVVYDSWTSPRRTDALEAWGTGDKMNYWQRNPWKTPRGNGYDFEVFPWLNGVVDADPDGDSIPNQTESMMPEMNVAAFHTDPTPLWMTDSSYTNSLVRRFFRLPSRFGVIIPDSDGFEDGDGNFYEFKDFDTWVPETLLAPAHFAEFNPDAWELLSEGKSGWICSFEENEGFDSDHDGISDYEEKEGKFGGSSDPQLADSPRRRQAMYFQGSKRPSALQTMPEMPEFYPTLAGYPDDPSFLQYTVECWVRPTSLADAVIVERAVWSSVENPADDEYMRKNFQIAIKDGYWYTKFDPVGTASGGPVEAVSKTAASKKKWTHLAATYDGQTLVFYVDGVAERTVRSGLPPCYGSEAMAVTALQKYWFDVKYSLKAVIIGASAKTQAEGAPDGGALDLTRGLGWSRYSRFFAGWVDEVRIWDGARTAAEIRESMNVRMTPELAASNRSAFYEAWADGRRRYEKNGASTNDSVPAELRYHWAFDSVFGADSETAVATAPHEFGGARALMSRPDGYEIPWWKTVLQGDGTVPGYANTVYADTDWVCWIPSTVAHLPRFDGTTLDSVYWSDDYKGDVSGSYGFARAAEPVSRWTQLTRAGVSDKLAYRTTGSRHLLVNTISQISGSGQHSLFSFTGRHLNQCGDDLVALGGAFAKYCDDEVDMWDAQGPSTNWEISGSDGDGDGLPDWWEQYADENYRPSGMDPAADITWSTVIDWNGLSITAGEAYLRDVARGAYMNEYGEIVVGPTKYAQRADEDANGIPDWWAKLYGISGESGLDDHDHDGLPNYVEYLLSEVFAFDDLVFDPTDPCSVDQYTPDYFYRVGSLYVGEIFTDHDLVEDEWEDEYPMIDDGSAAYASRLAYDAFADADEDGWSNRSEARYSKMVMPIVANSQTHYAATDGLVADYPIPTLALAFRYNGGRQSAVNTAPIIVEVTRASGSPRTPDAVFAVGAAPATSAGTGQDSTKTDSGSVSYTRTIGKWADRHMLGTLTPGNVALNSLAFEFCYDPSSVVYTWEVIYTDIYGRKSTTTKRGSRSEYDYDKRKYGESSVKLVSSDDSYQTLDGLELRTDETGSVATWVHNATGSRLGTVNLKSGAFDIDLGVFKGQYVVNSSNETEYASLEDQTFRIRYASQPSVGMPRRIYLGAADEGHVREGVNDIVAFADLDASGTYTPGEPYGIVQGVNVSWKGVSAEIELTDESPVTPRFDVWASGVALYNTTNAPVAGDTDTISADAPMRVRVVRWKIDDAINYNMAVSPRVVFDRMMDPRVATTLTEADFLGEDAHDIDWEYFSNEVANSAGVIFGNYQVVKAEYLVVLGDGPVSWLNSTDTNTWVTASAQTIVRRFDANRVLPVPVSPASVSPVSSALGVVSSANPTFAWKIDSDTYTAFRIVVTNGEGTVYDSGVRRAPVRDSDGVYRWTAPLYAGDMSPDNKVFANKAIYGWRVAMYNAKFRSDAYSTEPAAFYLNVQTNGYEYGTANVAVRYFGPDESYDAKAVRVQAFTSPDFTGIPVAAGYVKGKSATLAASGSAPAANCTIIGLPAGRYYLRAFIDSDRDGVCDDWESSGYLCVRDGASADIMVPTPITVGPGVGAGDLAVIYMEDADTDGDGLPDSWEYVKYGSLEERGIELLSETPAGELLVNTRITGTLKLREGAGVPTAGLSAALRSSLNNAGTLALALGLSTGTGAFADTISGAVSDRLAENGVSISSLELVDGKVYIAMSVATEAGEAATSPLVSASAAGGVPVKATVLWKQSLSDSQWIGVAEKEFTAGAGTVEIDVGSATDGTSGFYKVVVEEVK